MSKLVPGRTSSMWSHVQCCEPMQWASKRYRPSSMVASGGSGSSLGSPKVWRLTCIIDRSYVIAVTVPRSTTISTRSTGSGTKKVSVKSCVTSA
ncbi:hypothetical protein [Nannocystis pusilla]|uniref:hypothetical protein n=1 Tax=Nannocystis pusilla TaxID=889268 RepID=UPI003B7BC15D